VAAAASSEFEVLQIELMLAPELMKSAADANATNAINNVYSIKSWPCSFCQSRFITLFMEISLMLKLRTEIRTEGKYHSPCNVRKQTMLLLDR